MAIAFSSPQFGFTQFVPFNTPAPAICAGDEPPCLPVNDLSDLQFQIIASVDDVGTVDKPGFGVNGSFPACITNPLPNNFQGNLEISFNTNWFKLSTGVGAAPDIWVGLYYYNHVEAFFDALAENDCFTLSILLQTSSTVGVFLMTSSTCFYKTSDTCYTTLLSFGNANGNDAYGFIFIASYFEQARLPLYLHSPVNAEEEKSYGKSDGSTQKITHRVWKDYKFKTDYLDQATIEKIVIATSLDIIRITNPYAGIDNEHFVRTEKVETDWQQETMPLITVGQTKGTLRLADPRAYVNSNCQ